MREVYHKVRHRMKKCMKPLNQSTEDNVLKHEQIEVIRQYVQIETNILI